MDGKGRRGVYHTRGGQRQPLRRRFSRARGRCLTACLIFCLSKRCHWAIGQRLGKHKQGKYREKMEYFTADRQNNGDKPTALLRQLRRRGFKDQLITLRLPKRLRFVF